MLPAVPKRAEGLQPEVDGNANERHAERRPAAVGERAIGSSHGADQPWIVGGCSNERDASTQDGCSGASAAGGNRPHASDVDWPVARLPHLEAYIERLPQGLDSYPEALAKASLLRSVADFRPIPRQVREALPAALATLLEAPPPVTHWVSQVHTHSLLLVLRDSVCSDQEDFVRFCYLRQRELFQSAMYRVMFALATPGMLFGAIALRWGSLHRGTSLSIRERTDTTTHLQLDHAPHLWDPEVSLATAAGLRAVLDLSGAIGARVEVEHPSNEQTLFHGQWTQR